jgi:ADP-ribose pyrophosphatase YjhB (NUDIX family)
MLFYESTIDRGYTNPLVNKQDLVDHKGVAAVVRDEQGRVYIFWHVKFSFWTIPVGKVDPGESVSHALDKETGEELGIKVKSKRMVATASNTYDRGNGNNVTIKQHLFIVDKYDGKVKNNEPAKHLKPRWVTLDELRKMNEKGEELSDAVDMLLGLSAEDLDGDHQLR